MLTGVSGFVGSHLAQYLNERGFSVYGLIRKPIQNVELASRLSNIDLRVFTDADLTDIVADIKPDLVIHLASLYLTVHNFDQIDSLIQSNITFPTKLLEAMTANNVTKLINTGTSWQHYNSAQYDPVNLYAASKQAFEDIIKYYISIKKISCITLKLFDTYGPNDNRGKLISLLDKLSMSKEALAMSPGEQFIEITHIEDVCSAYLAAISLIDTMDLGICNSYGVFSNNFIRLKELVSEYERANNTTLNIKWGEREYREREVMNPCDNLKRIPGWEPKVQLCTGLKMNSRVIEKSNNLS